MVEPACSICGDLGWVHPLKDGKPNYAEIVRCRCKRESDAREREEVLRRHCALPEGCDASLANFQDYGDPDLNLAYRYACDLAEGCGNVKWLTLVGQKDRGKTHLAIAIARRWLERGRAARYGFVPLFLKELRDGFDLDGPESYRFRFDALCRMPLLVLDDLGVEKAGEWPQEQLQTLIDYRSVHQLALVVTTNRPLDQLKNDDEGRIASRLQRESWCRVVTIGGMEHRLREERK